MGWNQVYWDRPCPLMSGIESGEHFYFVHSYYVDPVDADVRFGTCEYGIRFTAVAWREQPLCGPSFTGKSQRAGLTLLRNFVGL